MEVYFGKEICTLQNAESCFCFHDLMRKHKAHPGAVLEGSKSRVWFFVEISSRLIRISEFCTWQLASSAVEQV